MESRRYEAKPFFAEKSFDQRTRRKKKVKSELLKIQEIVLKAEENLKDKVKFI